MKMSFGNGIHPELDDPYVVGYAYARECLLRSSKITISSFSKYMKSKGFYDDSLIKEIFKSIVIVGYRSGNISDSLLYKSGHESSGENEFDMLPDAYFSLVEIEELKEARENSKQAKNLALVAIIISAISIIISIFSLFITQEVRIVDAQFETVKTNFTNNLSE